MGIILKNTTEIAKMREAGKIVREVLDAVELACTPGVTTAALNQIAKRLLEKHKARSAFLGYSPHGESPYPAVLCASVNHVVVHGIPDGRTVLKEGDLISVDFACYKDGYCADAARTVGVGVISAPARALLDKTRESLARAIAQCHVGARLGDVGAAIEACVKESGFSVVRDYTGHGIGRAMHESPTVFNYGTPGRGLRLAPGLCLAIEPIVTIGRAEVKTLPDQWTVITRDRGLAAHVEHTVACTDNGPEVLTA
jgi:methionyl aminopeptidase